jgi:hypothetical protein
MSKSMLLMAATTTMAVLLFSAAGATLAQVETQDVIRCDPSGICYGTPGDDKILGTNAADEIRAKKGEDQVHARGGNDLVLGQRGDDRPGASANPAKRLEGGPGDDTVKGADGRDSVTDLAADDADRLFGGRDKDFVNGADGDDRDYLDCGPAIDFFDADPGDEVLPNCEKPF